MTLTAATEPTPDDRERVLTRLGALYLELETVTDPLHRLHLLRELNRGLDYEMTRTVRECRDVKVTWDLIADASGMRSKQAAQQRWS